MFGAKSAKPDEKTMTAFIEEGCILEGTLEFDGLIRLNGQIKGNVQTKDVLVIGPGAQVTGNIMAGKVVIGGKVFGDIECSYKVELLQTGLVHGNIKTPVFRVEEGGELQGQIVVIKQEDTKEKEKTEETFFQEVAKAS